MVHYMVWLSLILSRVMRMRIETLKPIREMLYMQPVYVGPRSVKDICLSKLSCTWGFNSIQLLIPCLIPVFIKHGAASTAE